MFCLARSCLPPLARLLRRGALTESEAFTLVEALLLSLKEGLLRLSFLLLSMIGRSFGTPLLIQNDFKLLPFRFLTSRLFLYIIFTCPLGPGNAPPRKLRLKSFLVLPFLLHLLTGQLPSLSSVT